MNEVFDKKTAIQHNFLSFSSFFPFFFYFSFFLSSYPLLLLFSFGRSKQTFATISACGPLYFPPLISILIAIMLFNHDFFVLASRWSLLYVYSWIKCKTRHSANHCSGNDSYFNSCIKRCQIQTNYIIQPSVLSQ